MICEPVVKTRARAYPPLTGEDWANCLTHGLGLALSVVGLIALVRWAVTSGDGWRIAGCIVFGASLVTLYAASTLYHGHPNPRLKPILQLIDHACIYVLIAGTYTPFTLTVLRGGWGWTLFGLIWGLAVIGILFKIFCRVLVTERFNWISTMFYVVMGWLVIIAVKPLVQMVPMGGLILIAAGGLAYTGGVVFYLRDHKPYFHTIWHLFVLAGSVFHFFAVAYYALPVAG